MTVSMQITKRIYQGNGVSTQWDVDFPFMSASDICVYITSPEGVEEEVSSHYAVDALAHTLTYPTAESGQPPLAEGWRLTVLRHTPLTQEIDLIRQGELDAEVLEEGYDKLTLLVQELNEQINRSIKYPVSTQESNLETEQFLSTMQAIKQDTLAAETSAQGFAEQAQTAAGAAQTAQTQAAQSLQQAQAAQSVAEAAQAAAETAQTQAAGSATDASGSATSASASATLAQSWAVKTGGAVSGGEYSAKYHAQQAASSAAEASTAKTAAQTAQSAAETAKTQAAGSATDASVSATAASTSATLAQNWAVKTDGAVSGGEYSAKYHAQQAASSASAAGTAKTAAESAKTAAQSAQSAAESAQSAAETAKTQASSSASAAANSASAAGTSATSAQNWAVKTDGAVSGGEYSAKYHAQQAAASASEANTAKTAAQSAQSAAETAKTQAASSASAAAGSASAASQSAQTCQELVASVGDPAAKDLSNVTSISASSAVQTALDAKAAVDLSNVSWGTVNPAVSFLQKGFKACLPDLETGYIDIAENTSYTCPQDGWVWTQGYFSGAAGQTITASVNDNALPNIGYNASSTYNFDSPQWFPVAKGDVWLCNRASRFYGLRG